MHITLAPMEGVVDSLMRDMLTRVGGYDLCVTEFIRIVDQLLPKRVFHRYCPELENGALTPAGTPVKIQLLGQDPDWLAENAARAIDLGSYGVDLNFGCPAKTVNKSKGGAVLLKEPDSIFQIVSRVRSAVPKGHILSAKMRLGFDDCSLAIDNAQAIAAAGADLLVIHARTKVDGYKPPAYWDWIARIKQHVDIDIVANGEIWSASDALECQHQSNCQNIMLGRGALALPNLALVAKGYDSPMEWSIVRQLLIAYSGFELYSDKGKYFPNRVKQWLGYLSRQYQEADILFRKIRALQNAKDILACIEEG
ncbi:tRNA-dihydrouridine synthase [Paraglaciecola hydrolytica]|uniref:tRNA-dihydrouridine(16) synthase n=1 Tax=Paraglaciecola hydrolytica TaxID=1799789 RepID=A0A136A3D3_9ALTE|nr:tRNA-dihydrouridine synthase [Paraglaciecola hydrolytica]KXI29751.1 tRNA dihydrouridine synthase DusC [Paraglaciecola hydrolytica]